SGMLPAWAAASSAMIAKVGVAARDSKQATLALVRFRPRAMSGTTKSIMSDIISVHLPLSSFSLLLQGLLAVCVAFSERRFSTVGHLHPLRVRRGLGAVVVVPVPPLVRRGLGVTLRRVFPSLLTAERRDIEVAPGGPHRLVAAVVDKVGAEHSLAVAEEHV